MSTPAPEFDSLGFHEATLLRVTAAPSDFAVELEGVRGCEANEIVVLAFVDVTDMTRDDVAVAGFRMERPDAEVLTFARDDNGFALILEWHDFALRASHVSAWRWRGQGPLVDRRSPG